MTDNPLSKLYRHKSIYIQLPSKGKYYTSGISLSIDNDLGIMPMTAKDEIILKSPDALFNGDGLINMIKSCAPDIKNPEEIPSCDVDSIILAVRAASKKTIEIEIECPHCNTTETYEIDLPSIIATAKEIEEEDYVIIGDNIKVNVRPYSLKSQLKANIQKFHHMRMEYVLSTNEIEDDKKVQMFSKAFAEATTLTMELAADNIVSVEISKDSIVDDRNNIKDWVENMDKDTYNAIIGKIKNISKSTIDNKVNVFCPACSQQYETLVELNPVNFFI